jgi:large subunit ribosomal protein L25
MRKGVFLLHTLMLTNNWQKHRNSGTPILVEEISLLMSTHRYKLEAQPRTIIGKQVRQLRAKGTVPAVVYGKNQTPVHIQIPWPNLRVALQEVGGTGLVDLAVGDQVFTTLVRAVDRHPIRRDVLHVDFHAVDLTETLVTTVPVTLKAEEEAAKRINGRVILEHQTLEVETLPTDIPDEIVIDLASLKAIGDIITLADLPTIENVSFVDDPDLVLVRTDYLTDAAEETEEVDTGSVEPEVISRGKAEEEEE